MTLYIVSYDITDTSRRTKISNILKDFGERVQYSVFECLMDSKLRGKMVERLKSIIKAEEDSIRIYTLCVGCEKNIEVIGQGELTKEDKYYIL
ncbi:MAG: hypothetical protein SCARUB_04686 [Candidatus Scalindua rubra]|uniref:CRISPR-associated endoribonuclease Cas2 n=1 Tax=Candidatus Scalindua rubra TaxID=1872076 RepID=A0A1E3X3L1_9BACT|nr:MAG: hypothetical protein SCARUB_04686 [Candidatus Scalindua rubra]